MKTIDFISTLLYDSKTAEPINNKADYTRVKKWVKKATKLYTSFSIIAVIITIMISIGSSSLEVPKIIILFVSLLTGWGFATMFLNFKLMIKSLWSSGVSGYRTGEQIQTKHVTVTHEYSNRYKVTTNTENEGCIVSMIYVFINFFVWSFLCVYVCPFLTFRKIASSKQNLEKFKTAKV